jgi:hypothetical protein
MVTQHGITDSVIVSKIEWEKLMKDAETKCTRAIGIDVAEAIETLRKDGWTIRPITMVIEPQKAKVPQRCGHCHHMHNALDRCDFITATHGPASPCCCAEPPQITVPCTHPSVFVEGTKCKACGAVVGDTSYPKAGQILVATEDSLKWTDPPEVTTISVDAIEAMFGGLLSRQVTRDEAQVAAIKDIRANVNRAIARQAEEHARERKAWQSRNTEAEVRIAKLTAREDRVYKAGGEGTGRGSDS